MRVCVCVSAFSWMETCLFFWEFLKLTRPGSAATDGEGPGQHNLKIVAIKGSTLRLLFGMIVLILKEEEDGVYPVCSVGCWLRGSRRTLFLGPLEEVKLC